MEAQPEIALVVDDTTWHIWQDHKQWLSADDRINKQHGHIGLKTMRG